MNPINLCLRSDMDAIAGLRVGTHHGEFHADEVLACAILLLVHGKLSIVRTRDVAVLDRQTIVLDVGGRYAPVSGRFDHHQKGGARERESGNPYATAGLVWDHYGLAAVHALDGGLAPDEAREVVRRVDMAFFRHVDAIDCGVDVAGPSAFQASSLIAGFNPSWDEDADGDTRFAEAVLFATQIVRNLARSAIGTYKARALVAQAKTVCDGRVLLLDAQVPWKGTVVRERPDVLFVAYPAPEGEWLLQVVPAAPGSFEARKDLPASWAGLRERDLDAATGVKGCVFCHNGRFICGHTSQEGLLRLAQQAVQA